MRSPNAWKKSLGLLLCAASAVGADAEKSAYSVLQPTPESEMREFITDRPDRTESPYSVDAGHVQVEADLATYFQDGAAQRSLQLGLVNLKLGLTNATDLQLFLPSPVFRGQPLRHAGWSDLSVRWKWNLAGNDTRDFAIAAMPYLKLPTAGAGVGNGRVEGGLIVPMALWLPDELFLGWMIETDFRRDSDDSRHHLELLASVTFGFDVVPGIEGYFECASVLSTERGSGWSVTGDAGVVIPLSAHWRADFGMNLGLTAAAPDWNPFAGVSARF